MNKQQDVTHEVSDFLLDDESLMELCASESTLGGPGRYREAGIGRFDA
ncbi:burhizin family lasso peptide [Mycetohabitans endofungorum]|nr:burhizin family lasso peptide [Mycetohabitans endofungorum]